MHSVRGTWSHLLSVLNPNSSTVAVILQTCKSALSSPTCQYVFTISHEKPQTCQIAEKKILKKGRGRCCFQAVKYWKVSKDSRLHFNGEGSLFPCDQPPPQGVCHPACFNGSYQSEDIHNPFKSSPRWLPLFNCVYISSCGVPVGNTIIPKGLNHLICILTRFIHYFFFYSHCIDIYSKSFETLGIYIYIQVWVAAFSEYISGCIQWCKEIHKYRYLK